MDSYSYRFKLKNLPKKLANGVGIGLISQFFADIIFTIATSNIILGDILISDISLYYGAASAGLITAYLAPFLDKFAIVPFSVITFAYVNNLVDSLSKDNDFYIDEQNIVFDIIVTEIVLFLFDRTAVPDYYNHLYERKFHQNPHLNADKTSFEFLFILMITNLIGFYDLNSIKKKEDA